MFIKLQLKLKTVVKKFRCPSRSRDLPPNRRRLWQRLCALCSIVGQLLMHKLIQSIARIIRAAVGGIDHWLVLFARVDRPVGVRATNMIQYRVCRSVIWQVTL